MVCILEIDLRAIKLNLVERFWNEKWMRNEKSGKQFYFFSLFALNSFPTSNVQLSFVFVYIRWSFYLLDYWITHISFAPTFSYNIIAALTKVWFINEPDDFKPCDWRTMRFSQNDCYLTEKNKKSKKKMLNR